MPLPVAPASVLPAAVASFFADIESTAASHATSIAANTAYSPGGTDVAVADGGTGASTAAVARTNLGLVIGTDVAAQSSLDGLDWKASCRVCSTTNVAVATGLVNGSTVDGVTLSTGNRVLLTGQTAGAECGIYVVVASGAASRSTDADTSAEVTAGMAVVVTEGTANGDAIWLLTTNDPITLATTALVFTKFGTAAVSDTAYGAGWDGDTTVAPSKNTVYDKIEGLVGTYAPLNRTLGYAEVTADQTGISTEADLTGLSVAVTVPAGRRVRISAQVLLDRTVADGGTALRIKEGATTLTQANQRQVNIADAETMVSAVIITPSTGAHTYKLSLARDSGTGTVSLAAGATYPAFILVEDIGT